MRYRLSITDKPNSLSQLYQTSDASIVKSSTIYWTRCSHDTECVLQIIIIIIIIIIAPLTIVSENQRGDFECLYKARQAAITDGGLFTDTNVYERGENERQSENDSTQTFREIFVFNFMCSWRPFIVFSISIYANNCVCKFCCIRST